MGRIERVDSEIVKELSIIINREIKDPRISGVITVRRAETTADLKSCKVYITAFECADKAELIKGLKSSSGFIKGLLFERLKIRNVPDLIFIYDEGAEHSMRIEQILKQLNENK